MIKDLKKIVQQYQLIPMENIDILAAKLDTTHCSRYNALTLLNVCRDARYDPNQHFIIENIWKRFKLKHKHLLRKDHYNQMLSYYSKAGRATEAQAIFDEIIANDFAMNP